MLLLVCANVDTFPSACGSGLEPVAALAVLAGSSGKPVVAGWAVVEFGIGHDVVVLPLGLAHSVETDDSVCAPGCWVAGVPVAALVWLGVAYSSDSCVRQGCLYVYAAAVVPAGVVVDLLSRLWFHCWFGFELVVGRMAEADFLLVGLGAVPGTVGFALDLLAVDQW